jgi:hypothetical protein
MGVFEVLGLIPAVFEWFQADFTAVEHLSGMAAGNVLLKDRKISLLLLPFV